MVKFIFAGCALMLLCVFADSPSAHLVSDIQADRVYGAGCGGDAYYSQGIACVQLAGEWVCGPAEHIVTSGDGLLIIKSVACGAFCSGGSAPNGSCTPS